MLNSFIAFDVETASNMRDSICEVGIARVQNREIVERKSWLIQPPGNFYLPFNTYLHGIGPDDTKDKPLFSEVWEDIKNYLQDNVVVCHNSAFDMGALRDALDFYGLEYPTFDIMCTIRPAKKTIPGLPSYTLDSVYRNLFGKEMENHHSACDDASACAEVLMECLSRNNISSRNDLEDIFKLRIGHISPESYRNQRAKDSHSSGSSGTWKQVKASEIVGDVEKNNPDSYFYGKRVCFTGAMSFSARKDLQQYIADIGGEPTDGVTKKTDILVVGQQDFRVVGDSGMSTKQRKAMDLLAKGQDIEILSEADFLAYAGDFPTTK